MTPARLRELVEAAVNAVEHTESTPAYCQQVFAELRARLSGAVLDVYFRGSEFVADAQTEGQRFALKIKL